MNHHPLHDWKNQLSEKNYPWLGLFLVSASSVIAECCATTNLDWVVVDLEASYASRQDLMHIAQAFNGSSVALLARVAQNNQQQIEAALDIGIQGIIVPKVSDKASALAVVKSCYYPPLGKRGLNPIRCSAYFDSVGDYLSASKNIACFVQIETQEAVENLEDIASVSGIQGLFIGCGDLALDYEIPGEFGHEKMKHAIQKVLNVCEKYHLVSGIFAYSQVLAEEYQKIGFQMIAIGNEVKFLKNEVNHWLQVLKK